MSSAENEMNALQYFQRKLHNLTHPVLGRILMLHRVVEQRSEGKNRELEITPQFLEQTIDDYCCQGYQFASIDESLDIILSGKRQRHPFVCITFDDGYHDSYSNALPLLKRLNIPFAIYVTTNFIDNKQPMWWYPNEALGLTLQELKSLDAEPLCTICAHTVSHPRLDNLTANEQRKEIAKSKETLEQWLGHSVDHFSYPHGTYNSDTLNIVNKLQFRSSLCAWGDSVRRAANPISLPRIELKQ